MVLNLRGINDNGHTFASFVCHGQRFMSVRGNHEYATGYADSERGHNPVADTVPEIVEMLGKALKEKSPV